MNMQARFLVALFVGSFFCAAPAWAGWVVTYSDAESGAQSKEYYQDGKANLGELIYTGKHFLVVDQDSRAYWKGTSQQYCESLRSQRQQLMAQMASIPAQYRPVPISQKKVTRRKVGTKSIAGYSATGYEFSVDGSLQGGQVWVSSDSGLSGVIDFERSMSKTMECFEGMDSASLDGAALYKQTIKKRFILKESYREVVSVEKKSVSAGSFVAPSGYASFSDYQKFMDHISNELRSSSPSSYSSEYMPQGMPQMDEVAEQESFGNGGGDSWSNDSARDSARDEQQPTEREVSEGISKDIKKGIGGFLKKIW